MARNVEIYLWDVATAVADTQSFTRGLTLETFKANPLVTAAVERKFEIIGEALKQMEAYFPGSTSSLPKVKQAIGMRDRLAHGYFTTNLDVLWSAIKEELPELKVEVERALAQAPVSDTSSSKS